MFNFYDTTGYKASSSKFQQTNTMKEIRPQTTAKLPLADAINYIGVKHINPPQEMDLSKDFNGGFGGVLTSSPKIKEEDKLHTKPIQPNFLP
jgi:hypothetical protein